MSTLKVTNIQATGETASRAVSGVAAAWVQANAAATVIASLNISSGTDVGVGDYRNGIINAMVDTDSLVYTVTQRTSNQNTTATADDANITASQISTNIATASTGSFTDTLWNGVVHGDLA